MKTRLLFLLIFFSASTYASAVEKTPKIGYVKWAYVMSLLPDTKQVEIDFKAFENQIRKKLQAKLSELQDKLESFQQGHATMTEAVKNQKEAELQRLHGDFEQLQMESQNSLADKQAELIRPIYEKVRKAVEAVAKENKFTHVLNDDTGSISVILYAEKEYDITDLVLKKLGIDSAKIAIEMMQKAAAQKANQKPIQKSESQSTGKKVQESKTQGTDKKVEKTKVQGTK